jgi:hypothetical protein
VKGDAPVAMQQRGMRDARSVRRGRKDHAEADFLDDFDAKVAVIEAKSGIGVHDACLV